MKYFNYPGRYAFLVLLLTLVLSACRNQAPKPPASIIVLYTSDTTFPYAAMAHRFSVMTSNNFKLPDIDTSSIVLINDSFLHKYYPDSRFYSFTFFTGEFEFNNGRVPAVAAVSNNNGYVTLLLPQSYCHCDSAFIALLLNKEVKENKEAFCKAIGSLLLKAVAQTNCEDGMENIRYSVEQQQQTYHLQIHYTERECLRIPPQKNVESLFNVTLLFREQDSLKAISYE